jgi:hypothetical protein
MKGFRKLVAPGQTVAAGGQLTLNLTLELGTAVQTVEVSAAPGAELQTLNSAMSTSVGGDTLLNLPSTDRDAATVLFFVPTAIPNFHVEGNWTSGQVAGAFSDQNTYYLDGASNTDTFSGDNAYVSGGHGVVPMPMESIQEFKVVTNNQTADFNAASGGEVLLVSKRGTNTLHGSVYEYYQGQMLNSADWWYNTHNLPKNKWHSNRFGGSLGGPMLPTMAGGKTFFYFNYEGNRYPRSGVFERNVPSDLMRQGIVQFRDATGTPISYQIKDYDPRGIGLNPVAKQLWDTYMPEPNDPKCTDLNSKCYFGGLSYPLKDDYFMVRMDHDFGSKWRAFVGYTWFNENNPSTRQVDFGGLGAGHTKGQFASASSVPRKPRRFVMGLTGSLTPSLTNEFHFSYVRGFWQWLNVGAQPQISGIPGALEFGESSQWIPVNVDTQNARQRLWNEHNWDYRDTLSWLRGNHFFQFGGEYLHQWWHFDRYDNVVGGLTQYVIQMTNGQGMITSELDKYTPTLCPEGSTTATGCLRSDLLNSWRNYYGYLLGFMGQSSIVVTRHGENLELNPLNTPAHSYVTAPQYTLYFNDSWHIRPNLTLSYGLNWGTTMPPYERNGLQDILVDSSNNIMTAEDYLANRKRAALAGQMYNPPIGYTPIGALGAKRKYPIPPFWGGWNPRVSLAYSPAWDSGIMGKLFGHKSTVVRGGYARIYDRSLAIDLVSSPIMGVGFMQPLVCRGASRITMGCEGVAKVTPTTAFRVGVDGNVPPFPAIPDTLTSPVIPGVNAAATVLADTLDYNWKPAASDVIDFSIQRQLKGNVILEVGYMGRWSRRLFTSFEMNAVPWMMKFNGQQFATAYDNLYFALAKGATPAVQPFFESALAGSSFCTGYSSCTAGVAAKESGNIMAQNVWNLWSDMDSSFVFGPNTLISNQTVWGYNHTTGAISNYQALTATLTKRAGHGLTLNSNLTYGRNLGSLGMNQMYTLQSPANSWDVRADYGPQFWDRKLTINVLGTYELPFGKGRRWASSNPVLTRVLGGWSLTPIFTYGTGLPDQACTGSWQEWGTTSQNCGGPVPLGGMNTALLSNSAHPGVKGSGGIGVNADPANGGIAMNMFPDPAAVYKGFRPNLVGLDGRTFYNVIRGQSRWNLDLGITKDTRITERWGIQIFAQMFNALNHMMWGDPGLTLQDPAGWGVIGGEYGAIGSNNRRVIQLGARVHF